MKFGSMFLVLFFILVTTVCVLSQGFPRTMNSLCPKLYHKVLKGYGPRGNLSSGNFTVVESALTLSKCVTSCCVNEKCNEVLMKDSKCYHIACVSNELCIPKLLSLKSEEAEQTRLVLVRPVQDADSWREVLAANEEEIESRDRRINRLLSNEPYENAYDDGNLDEPLLAEESNYKTVIRECHIGLEGVGCPINEECMKFTETKGMCTCKVDYERNGAGLCVALQSDGRESSTPPVKETLIVTVESQQVRLPNNKVTLSAKVTPEPVDGQKYEYEWKLLQQPDGTNTIKNKIGGELSLEQLAEGLYTFKLTVTGPGAYGETFANVTVLSPERINKPPVVVITPAAQTVKLPNTVAVLDASSSTDDARIVSYHWELQQGPLGYQPHLTDNPTLQLKDLKDPGNYTFKLTLTDSDHATNSSTANITVLKITDYPPEANAGQDVILYLPHNKITLVGNLSTDDHAISTWEWTKSPSDGEKAADMQDTRTPYLRLSDLEEGMYTFVLKVTDSANQSSSSEVHVFVKPPTNQPPVAEAGDNQTTSLPQTWIVLNANKSTDDNKIVAYKWEQLEGPSDGQFVNANASSTNVTALTKGQYTFKVSVTDDNGNVASDTVVVTVNQNENQKPTANAGGDREVQLPLTAVYLNGTASKDDLAIRKWQWTRQDDSLALGRIVEATDASPILILTDISPGRFVFQLKVTDDQGLTDTDSVTLKVKNDPKFYSLVRLTLMTDADKLTEQQFSIVKAKLSLLVQDGTKLTVREMTVESWTNNAIVSFYVTAADGRDVAANDVVRHLRSVDQTLLGYGVADLRTAVCQNPCSGHGVCEETSRKCLCEAFWMQDLWRLHLGDGDSDCSWSILYVSVASLLVLVITVAAAWTLVWLCLYRKRGLKAAHSQAYSLIQQQEVEMPAHCFNGRTTITDSDTDSDVLFESRSKSSRQKGDSSSGRNNGAKSKRISNGGGFKTGGRRIKT